MFGSHLQAHFMFSCVQYQPRNIILTSFFYSHFSDYTTAFCLEHLPYRETNINQNCCSGEQLSDSFAITWWLYHCLIFTNCTSDCTIKVWKRVFLSGSEIFKHSTFITSILNGACRELKLLRPDYSQTTAGLRPDIFWGLTFSCLNTFQAHVMLLSVPCHAPIPNQADFHVRLVSC